MKKFIAVILSLYSTFIVAQCNVNYSYTGNADTLQFTNLSGISNAHFYWNFGDGSTSYAANPTHVFPESGKYLVTLYAKDTILSCHNYYESWITVTKASTSPCIPLLQDSLMTFGSSVCTEIKDLSSNCYSYSNIDAGPAQNFSPGNCISLNGWRSWLLCNRLQFYSSDSITGFVVQREYYKTQHYNFTNALNYDACSANFEYHVSLQANGALVSFKAMNPNASSYKFELVGMGNPIYINSSSGSYLYQYVSYEKYFPWMIGLTTEDPGGCKDTVWQIMYILNPYYKTPPTCAIAQQPQSQTVFSGNNAEFIIDTSPLVHKQWQQDAGLGFVNLTNAGPYSGVHTDTLSVANVQSYMNNYHYRCVVSENFSGCHNTSNEVILTHVVGLREYELRPITIYPNPAVNTITIEKNHAFESSTLEITNYLGQAVLVSKFSNEVNVSGLAQGLYTLKIKTADNLVYSSKFVKEN
jgi:hypothetical protein